MGAGQKTNNGEGVTYYNIYADGNLWDKNAGEDDPQYKRETFPKQDGSEGVRYGAKYGNYTGKIVSVFLRQHQQYGLSINVKISDGEEVGIISASADGNKFGTDLMRVLISADIDQPITIEPYCYINKKTEKKVRGVGAKQNGKELQLTPNKDETMGITFISQDAFRKLDSKKQIRLYEDQAEEVLKLLEEMRPELFEHDDSQEGSDNSIGKSQTSTTTANNEASSEEVSAKDKLKAKLKAMRNKDDGDLPF